MKDFFIIFSCILILGVFPQTCFSKQPFYNAFDKRSKIDTILISQQQVVNLTLLGQVWGFLKYHHPAVANGNYNMDDKLFDVLPAVTQAENNTQLSIVLEKWVDQFGALNKCEKCRSEVDTSGIVLRPSYGNIFNDKILDVSLVSKLKNILNNGNNGSNYYASVHPTAGYPIFNNELAYEGLRFPDIGYRLLSLYRYWNIIQYFYPTKHLIENDWSTVLDEFVPKFINVSSSAKYVLTVLELISNIHDSHADIGAKNAELEQHRGVFALPFQAKFIENRLVVTGYYADTLSVKSILKLGDIIKAIDGVSVENLISKYRPIAVASNEAAFMRDLARSYLLRSNKKAVFIDVSSNGVQRRERLGTIHPSRLNTNIDFYPNSDIPAYSVIDDKIGYIFAGKYKNKDLNQIKNLLKDTKGLIIDMRTYPSDAMAFTLIPYLKEGKAPSVMASQIVDNYPGFFRYSDQPNARGAGKYKGKIVIIVNEVTQSLGELTTMSFQSSPNVTVIGSTTAGANGSACPVVLPGGIKTYISGVGILYPDSTETQRKGIKLI